MENSLISWTHDTATGVPFHFKQWGQYEPDANDKMQYVRVKDHNAVLDGVEYKEFPVNQ